MRANEAQLNEPTQELQAVADIVRSELEFDPKYGIDEHPRLGNCYAFGDRAHQTLSVDEAGHHYVAYAYDHAFNLGATATAGAYFISSDVPGLAATERDAPVLRDFLEPELLDSVKSGSITNHAVGYMNPAAIDGALSMAQINEATRHNNWFAEMWLKGRQPAVTIMEASFAHEALANYCDFRRGIWYGVFELTRDSLEALRVRTPQHETRPAYNEELRNFKRFIRHMARNAVASATDLDGLVKQYEEILPESNAGANIIFGDCYKEIAKKFGSSNAAQAARKRYRRAGSYSRFRRHRENPLVRSKLDALNKLAAK